MKRTIIVPEDFEESGGADKQIYVVAEWRKEIGDVVQASDVLILVRPAAGGANVPIVTSAPGILSRKFALPGEPIEPGEPLAILSEVLPAFAIPSNLSHQRRSADAHDSPGMAEKSLPLSPSHLLLAQHNVRSLRTSPHVLTTAVVDLGEVMRLQGRIASGLAERESVTLGLLPFLLSSAGAALIAYPELRGQFDEKTGTIHQFRSTAISFILGPPERRCTPVVQEPDKKSIRGLAREVADLTARAGAGILGIKEQTGAVFTISNETEETPGILWQSPIIPQPQAAILSLGAVTRQPVALDNDSIVVRPILPLCLAHDARFIASRTAAAFLAAIKRSLEEAHFLFS